MLTLTPNAKETIEQILTSSAVPDGAGIRIMPLDAGDRRPQQR
jgi:hypothetical protein